MQCSGGCSTPQQNMNVPLDTLEKTNRHPCYSSDAHHKFARMHIPVAPKCNISCNYCNRKYDCQNESRPGVTSEILTPEAALAKFNIVQEKIEQLSVVGIAGPGDALANWSDTKRSIELIKAVSPETIFCLSTNGLLLPDYGPQIIKLGVQHVTVTVNCLDPEIGAQIYKYVRFQGREYKGRLGATILIGNQLAGIEYLAQHGVMVKVNIVMIKGINDGHIPQVVKKVKQLGAFITNIMPLIPAGGSVFEDFPQTSMKELNKLRDLCQLDIQQMRHCKQCRADAIGLLGEDRSQEFSSVSKDKIVPEVTETAVYKIAVASKNGTMVDQHFGHTNEFAIYQGNGQSFQLVGKSQVQKYCTGPECDAEESRRASTLKALQECDAVLTMRIGYHAKEKLLQKGIEVVESCDTVENGLMQTYNHLLLATQASFL